MRPSIERPRALQLRDYQLRTVEDVCSTDDRVCVAAPTGSGKTVIGSAIAARYDSVCWVAHREELIEQARSALQLWAPKTLRTVVTIQSIGKPSAHMYDLLALDECHHYAADDWSRITTNVQHARLIGLTATPSRGDGKGLGNVFDRIVTAANYSELLERGQLVPCRITAGPEDQEGIAANPLKAWQEHGEDALTIAFAPTIASAEKWCSEFVAAGIKSACVFGSSKDRHETLAAFREGRIKVVWNFGILTEGFDVPAVACVLLARKLGTPGLYLQCVGRGLRPYPGKSHCRLLDLAGNYRDPDLGIPTIDRDYSLAGKAIRRNKVQRLRQCLRCGTVCLAWVGECPECKFVTPRRKLPIKIDDQDLLEVYDGQDTLPTVRDRFLAHLRKEQLEYGHGLQWTISHYKKLFGNAPVIRDATELEKSKHYVGLLCGLGPVRSKFAYKTVFGHYPPRTESYL